MTLDSKSILDSWREQLEKDVAPYILVARQRGHGVQVVLFLDQSGKIGQPKITVSTIAARDKS